MLTPQEEEHIYTVAYVPEHIVSLMVSVSRGEPFLTANFVYYVGNNWLIFVGYPLDDALSPDACEAVLKDLRKRFRPEYLWFIGETIPPSLASNCTERESDQYYKLELSSFKIRNDLRRALRTTSPSLRIERSRTMSRQHAELSDEFISRENPSPRIKAFYLAMPDYVSQSPTAVVLNGWSDKGDLSAYYVVELGAKTFATYVVGCHSKKHYTPHASDLLFLEMIRLSQESGKTSIHLGLGVNPGIRRFKEKWGGVPFLKYEFCEQRAGHPIASFLRSIEEKL
jgi:hypothetical protein